MCINADGEWIEYTRANEMIELSIRISVFFLVFELIVRVRWMAGWIKMAPHTRNMDREQWNLLLAHTHTYTMYSMSEHGSDDGSQRMQIIQFVCKWGTDRCRTILNLPTASFDEFVAIDDSHWVGHRAACSAQTTNLSTCFLLKIRFRTITQQESWDRWIFKWNYDLFSNWKYDIRRGVRD